MNEKRMSLGAVQSGRIERPIRALLYGVEGVGKSTFAAGAPSPIFLCSEDGTATLDVARFPEPRNWADARDAIESLIAEPHDYKTLVIDTLDWLEPMIWTALIERTNGKMQSIEDFGYGKGYSAALDEWRAFLARVEALRAKRSMHVVLLAHSQIKAFKNPLDADYDRFELKLNGKASGLLKEWCDAVLFARYETFADVEDRTKRVRGVASGARIIHTEHSAAWDAKNRYDLAPVLPLSWQAFAEAVAIGKPAEPAALAAQIEALLVGAADEFAARVRVAVKKADGNAAQLARIADRLVAESKIRKGDA